MSTWHGALLPAQAAEEQLSRIYTQTCTLAIVTTPSGVESQPEPQRSRCGSFSVVAYDAQPAV